MQSDSLKFSLLYIIILRVQNVFILCLWLLYQTVTTSLGDMYVYMCVFAHDYVCTVKHLLLCESRPPVNMAAVTTVTERDVISRPQRQTNKTKPKSLNLLSFSDFVCHPNKTIYKKPVLTHAWY